MYICVYLTTYLLLSPRLARKQQFKIGITSIHILKIIWLNNIVNWQLFKAVIRALNLTLTNKVWENIILLHIHFLVKFIYSEKARNVCEISTVDLSHVVTVKSKVEISQNFVNFSEYMKFIQTKIATIYFPLWRAPGSLANHSTVNDSLK